MSQYVFRVNKNHKFAGEDDNVKKMILENYDHFMKLIHNDSQMKELVSGREKISDEILSVTNILQQQTDKEQIKQLQSKLSQLTTLYNKMDAEYKNRSQKELETIYQKWPSIFDMIIGTGDNQRSIDRDTLEDVLTMYQEYKSGHISEEHAITHGMCFMNNKYHLPKDFFNENAVHTFIANKDKLI